MNANTAITRQLMRTLRTLVAEWRKILWGRVSTGAKEDESIIGRVLAAGFCHVSARSRLAGVSESYETFISLIFQFLFRQRRTADK
jgi:hypothetical protein